MEHSDTISLHECQRALTEARARVEALKSELATMRQRTDAERADLTAQAAFLKNELQTRGAAIEHLRRRVDEVVAASVAERARQQAIFDAQQRTLQQTLDDTSARCYALTVEVAGFEHFAAERVQLVADVAAAREEAAKSRATLRDETSVYEQRLVAERARLQDELASRLAEARVAAAAEAAARLDGMTRQAFAENREYAVRVRTHGETLRRIDGQRTAAETRAARLAEENAVLADQLAEAAKLGNSRKRALADTRAELAETVATLERERGRAKEERDRAAAEEATRRQEAETAQGVLQRRVDGLEGLLRKAKATTERVLRERREVERFLLDALAEVRAEHAKAGAKPVSAGATASVVPLRTLEQVGNIDARSMTHEQREQVLVLLISKLHAATVLQQSRRVLQPVEQPPTTVLPEVPSLVPEFLLQQVESSSLPAVATAAESAPPTATFTTQQVDSNTLLRGDTSKPEMPPLL